MWIGTKDGSVSVKSAYNFLCDRNPVNIPVDWKGIWYLNIMPRVKLFLWKTLSGCLPVREVLGRYTPIDINCPLCNNYVIETVDHLFTRCVFSEAIWRGLSFSQNFYSAANISYKNWCLMWLKDCTNRNFFAYVLWYIWKYRCKVVFDNVTPDPNDLIEFIKKDIPQYLRKSFRCSANLKSTSLCDAANLKSSLVCDISHPGCIHESFNRLQDVAYIYFDAAFQNKSNKFAYGIVEVNNEGLLVEFTRGTRWCSSAEEAESRACREATRWGQSS
ncbi:uncharacterized protein LOC113339687 [Papaver somniferum]|uniref:uncharacterized protein LOC113339687 n=1 Tax=Papaver somniferum TaxID=3469 RepID=UPI000E7024EA|nr:uncharacterized protein LOC113339687 [Papaver somniferum]